MQLPRESLHYVHLTKEKETLFITLYAKALDNRSRHPIWGDKTADALVSSLAYDFHKLKGAGNDILAVLRAKQFDDWTREFLAKHPDATVLHPGCGLDTRVMRVILCERVNQASPCLPDGRRLSLTIQSSCCVLAAQKVSKYRDSLMLFFGSG